MCHPYPGCDHLPTFNPSLRNSRLIRCPIATSDTCVSNSATLWITLIRQKSKKLRFQVIANKRARCERWGTNYRDVSRRLRLETGMGGKQIVRVGHSGREAADD